MKIIEASYEIITPINGEEMLRMIERAGRVCYRSEDRISSDSTETFIRNIVKRGHESVLEHCSFSVRFICDRGVSHELVRHRIASFSQESTRYCNYSGDKFGSELTFITDEFKFKLKKLGYDRFDKLITVDEKEITPQELRKAFTNINTEPTDREEPLIHRPSKLEPLANVEPLEELLDD